MIVTGHCEINLKKRYWKYQIKIYYVHFRPLYSIGRAYRHITQRFRSRTPRMYCHLITLVTTVYRKTSVFLTTVGTATPPGRKMGEWSPLHSDLIYSLHWSSLFLLVILYNHFDWTNRFHFIC
jgi:hypothetical protein